MKIIPFRIKASEEEDNYSDVYAFLIQGTSKDAYEVEIDVDSLNDLGITDTRCTCPHYTYRETECKHIEAAKKILKEFNIDIETKTPEIITADNIPKCPKCEIDMKLVKTMKGHYYQCPNYFKCAQMDTTYINNANLEVSDE